MSSFTFKKEDWQWSIE